MNVTRRRALLFAACVVSALAFLYVVLPQLGGVRHTWARLDNGDSWWIAVAVLMELLSIASYIAVFRGVSVPRGSPIGWPETYQITMAGLAATRVFAAGGAGGVAVTAWALRRSGMGRREVAERMVAFLVLLYGVYMAAMVVCGVGLYTGVFPGAHPFAITIGPAIFGALVILVFLAIALVPEDLEPRVGSLTRRNPKLARWVWFFATAPSRVSEGVRFAWRKVRHPEWALIGALVAFGVSGSLALIAVLTYRLLAFWLPTIPGAIAYFQLRRTVHRWHEREAVPARVVAPRVSGDSVAA